MRNAADRRKAREGGPGAAPPAAAAAAAAPPKRSKLASVVSGALSGATVSACVQPLDVMRTRMQADVSRGTYLSTVQTVRAIAAHGGVRALWQGTQPTVIRLGLGAGLHFFFLETIKPLLLRPHPDGSPNMSAVGAALTGGLSRAMAALISCPVTVVKTRMEYVGAAGVAPILPRYRNTAHALRTIGRTEGVRGLYRGLGPTIMSNAPFSALYYMFYTRLQHRIKAGPEPTTAENFASGAVAAVAATLITQPADVVRTQVQLGLAAQVAGGAARVSSLQVLRGIAAAHGARGLLAGAAPRVLKRTLQTALVWTLYEELVPRMTRAKEWVAEAAAS
jgi:solute carrier family 25 protein 38